MEKVNIECSICLSDFTTKGEHIPIALGCGHTFGKCCLQEMMSRAGRKSACPHDRIKIGKGFHELHPNYTLVSCLPFLLQSKEVGHRTISSETYLKGAAAVIKGIKEVVSQKIKSFRLKIETEKSVRESQTIEITALKKQLLKVKSSLQTAEEAYKKYSDQILIDDHSLRGLEQIYQVIRSKSYLNDTEDLCKNITERRVLAFSEIESSFDLKLLRARRSEVQDIPGWKDSKKLKEYYISLLKLEYHYRFPLIEDKFDIWNMLDNRMKQRKLNSTNRSTDKKRRICEKMCEMNPNVTMEIRFDMGEGRVATLDVFLRSTINEVKELARNTFNISIQERYLYLNGSELKDGKLFDLDVLEGFVFSFLTLEGREDPFLFCNPYVQRTDRPFGEDMYVECTDGIAEVRALSCMKSSEQSPSNGFTEILRQPQIIDNQNRDLLPQQSVELLPQQSVDLLQS